MLDDDRGFGDRLLSHLSEVAQGECSVSEEDVEEVGLRDETLAEILAGVLLLHETIEYQRQRLVNASVHKEVMAGRARAAKTAKLAAENSSQAKSEFLARISHELRTPLNAIIGFSEILQESAKDAGQPEMIRDLGHIQGAGTHLLGLINDILDLSKIEAGQMNVWLEEVALAPLVDDVVSTIRPLVEENNNVLHVHRNPNLGTVFTDGMRVRQILLNLLGNACKFTDEGTIEVMARRTQKRGKEWVRFVVADTGIGITPEQLNTLFDPFSQGDESTTRLYGGTGLGLPLCREFCDMLGGKMEVSSVYRDGSRFEVLLPTAGQELERHKGDPAGH